MDCRVVKLVLGPAEGRTRGPGNDDNGKGGQADLRLPSYNPPAAPAQGGPEAAMSRSPSRVMAEIRP